MSVPKQWLLGGWYTRELIVHMQRNWPNDNSWTRYMVFGSDGYEFNFSM